MTIKTTALAGAILALSALSVSAGNVLDTNIENQPTEPVVVTKGGLGFSPALLLPLLLLPLLSGKDGVSSTSGT